jgi:glutathione S-transferase
MNTVQIIGRRSSHFTRVPLIFAYELGVPFEFVPVHDMTSVDSAIYAGNPALKLPTLRRAGSSLFGAENICRALVDLAEANKHVVWPEQTSSDLARNAHELVWHGMAAEVQLIFGTGVGSLSPDNIYFAKARKSFDGALQWLNNNLTSVLRDLPSSRDVSVFEVTLFCLVEHIAFRGTICTISLEPYPALTRFAKQFASRLSAQRTPYRFDSPAATDARVR